MVEIYGRNGYMCFNEADGKNITVHIVGEQRQVIPVPERYNPPQMRQCESFVNLLNGITDEYTSTISDGIRAQLILDAAELSGSENRYVTIKEIADKIK